MLPERFLRIQIECSQRIAVCLGLTLVIALATWLVVFAVSRYVSLASIVAAVALPPFLDSFVVGTVLVPFLVFSLAATGLNLLTGYTGLLSLGTGAFLGVGAYACYKLTTIFPEVNIIIWIFNSDGRQHVLVVITAWFNIQRNAFT